MGRGAVEKTVTGEDSDPVLGEPPDFAQGRLRVGLMAWRVLTWCFPLVAASGAHPTSIPARLGVGQLFWLFLHSNTAEKQQKADYAAKDSEPCRVVLARANKDSKQYAAYA